MRKRSAVIVGLAALCLLPAKAGGSSRFAGTRAFPFLLIPVGPRLSVGPGVLVDYDPDPSLTFANPAGLGWLDEARVYLTSSNWLEGMNTSAVAVSLPWLGPRLSAGIGLCFLFGGKLRGYDDALAVVEKKAYYDMVLEGALARRFGNLSIGIRAGYLRDQLPSHPGQGYNLSLGGYYRWGANAVEVWSANLAGRVIYSDVDYSLDRRLIVGYTHALQRKWGTLLLGFEADFSQYGERKLSFGASYRLNGHFCCRLGSSRSLAGTGGTASPFSAGFSVELAGLSLDYSFLPNEYFPATHTFAVSFGMGRAEEESAHLPTTSLDAPSPSPSYGRSEGVGEVYFVVGGIHRRREGAEAEARALKLLGVPASIEKLGEKFAVTVGKFTSKASARKLVETYRAQGHRFSVFRLQPN